MICKNILLPFLTSSLIGCSSFQFQTQYDKDMEDMKKLNVERAEYVDFYFCNYKASWRSKKQIRKALDKNFPIYRYYVKNVCETMKQMDTDKDHVVTDKEVDTYVSKFRN